MEIDILLQRPCTECGHRPPTVMRVFEGRAWFLCLRCRDRQGEIRRRERERGILAAWGTRGEKRGEA